MPDETIDGFPEYAFTIDTPKDPKDPLKDPNATKRLRALAKRIVASHSTALRIIGFEVHGHADVALRVPAGPERTRTEMEVSRDRADNAKELLLKFIEEEGGKPIMGGIRANTSSVGVGSQCRKVLQPKTEAEMRRNRRVEIFLKVFNFHPPPQPHPPAPPPAPKPNPPEKGKRWSIRIKSGRLIALSSPVGELLTVTTIKLTVEITDLDRGEKAEFIAEAKGFTLGSTFPPAQSALAITTVEAGPAREFKTTDVTTLSAFRGKLVLGQNAGVSVSVLSSHGEFIIFFEALQTRTTPNPVPVEGGSGAFSLPQGSFGISPGDGSLEMQDSPVPVR